MTQLEGIALLAVLCGGTVLSGYWLAAMLSEATASERLAVSLLAGLGTLLLLVSLVNFFAPLAWPWAGLCLVPIPATFGWGRSRRLLRADLVTFGRDRETLLVGALLAIFFAALLWPMLTDPHCVFYDGTANNDSFFWITFAEFLKRHSYMEVPVRSALQPLGILPGAITGWTPAWGRMGAEGLFALSSTVANTSPLKIYLYATASLFLPWVAAVFLTAKTFFNRKLTVSALIGLAVLQPIFIFFYSNANLPNLLGVLMGAAVVLAAEHALRTPPGQPRSLAAWWLLLALGVHGLYCSYPEMIPFVALPAGLLWLRRWFDGSPRPAWKSCLPVAGAVAAGSLLNPATTVRAVHGFFFSFTSARADVSWANLFEPLSLPEYFPALGTLAVPAASELDFWLGLPASILLFLCLFLTLWRARDRLGALLIFAGSAALLIYTIVTGFSYGWQKTVQFSGVFVAAVFPVGMLDALARERRLPDYRRGLAWAATLAVGAFMIFATVMNCREIYKYSQRKLISQDWFALRDLSREGLRRVPVVVDTDSFLMSFFHSMWAAYFLPDSYLYYAAREKAYGGYLQDFVLKDDALPRGVPHAVLVGRPWADAFEPRAPRLLNGREFVLLGRINRFIAWRDVYPLEGVPQSARPHFSLTLQPGSAGRLVIKLGPQYGVAVPPGEWHVANKTGEQEHFHATVAGRGPWRLEVPLVARQAQTIQFDFSTDQLAEWPFSILQVQLLPETVPLSPANGRIDFSASGNWEDYQATGLFALTGGDAVAGSAEAVLQFVAPPATDDVELELVAHPRFASGGKDQPLPVELWFNEHLVFSGPFIGPGVLRARILREHWQEKPVARLKLRLPQYHGENPVTTPQEPVLVLRYLTTRAATASRPP